MKEFRYTDQELKLTAIIYATDQRVKESMAASGRLPKSIPNAGFWVAMKVIIARRGTDPVLTEFEQQVYEAIKRERRLPGGAVILVSQHEQ